MVVRETFCATGRDTSHVLFISLFVSAYSAGSPAVLRTLHLTTSSVICTALVRSWVGLSQRMQLDRFVSYPKHLPNFDVSSHTIRGRISISQILGARNVEGIRHSTCHTTRNWPMCAQGKSGRAQYVPATREHILLSRLIPNWLPNYGRERTCRC